MKKNTSPPVVSFRPFRSLVRWLLGKPDKTEVINEALLEHKRREAFEEYMNAPLTEEDHEIIDREYAKAVDELRRMKR